MLIADCEARYLDVYDIDRRYERIEGSVEMYSPPNFPALPLPLRAIFAKLYFPDAELI